MMDLSRIIFTYLLIAFSSLPARAGDTRDIAFTAAFDGSVQRYVLVLPDGFDPNTPAGLLIALHGHGSDRTQFINDPRPECRAARDAAAKYRQIYISPDYRAKTSWMGPAAEADLVQIIADLRKRYRISSIVISGGSMGGTGALTFAALHPDMVDGVVALNGTADLVAYDQFTDAIAASFGGSKTDKPDEYQRRSALFHADKLTMPIAVTTGGQDKIVPPDSVLQLVEKLRKLNRNHKIRLIHQPNGGHNTTYDDAATAFAFVLDAMKERKP